MRVSDHILDRLADAGIDTAFMVYGGAMAELADAFTRQSRIRYVCPQHEQAAGFMAEGYAKTKGVPGVAIVTSGPGGGNLVTAIQNCYYDSVPCVFITGQVATKLMRPAGSNMRQLGFQETPIVDIVRPITKYAQVVQRAPHIGRELDMAIRVSKSRRPGPVLLDVPIDVQRTEINPATLQRERLCEDAFDNTSSVAQQFLHDLSLAARPVILVGGGARKSRMEILDFADAHSIPVFRTWNALDVVTDDSRVYAGTVGTYGGPGRNFGIQNADLLLVLGCRMSGRILGGMPHTFARGAKIYRVDLDEAGMLHAERKADVNIHHSVRQFILSAALYTQGLKPTEWLGQCRAWIEKYDPVRPEHLSSWHHYGFVRRLSEALPDNAIVVYDTGGNAIMMGHCFRSKARQRIFSSNGNTPMGFALAGAIGAWFADPSRPVYCIIGDGGMQLNIQELQTIKHYRIPVKVIVLNNHILGNTKSYQRANGMAEVGCGPDGYSCPDFVAIARAYGIEAVTIDKLWGSRSSYATGSLEEMLPQVIAHSGPLVVDIVHHDFCTYEPRMSRWDTPIEEMYPYLPREEFRANMIIEPWERWEGIK